MSAKTGIEWTDETWNPIRGCSRVSEGCRHCYAERMAGRFSGPGQPYEGLAKRVGGEARWTGKVRFDPKRLEDPLRWRKPRRVFVNSMSDLFHESLPDEVIADIFMVMALARRHTFQVLTKRPERMRQWFAGNVSAAGRLIGYVRPRRGDWTAVEGPTWPLPNVWLGVSVEGAGHEDRIAHLLAVPAAVRFVSAEPLLGPVKVPNGLDWVIAGGESGPNCRPMDLDWVRQLRDQCVQSRIPFFLKQLGGWPDKQGGDKAVLDGVRWVEMPEVAP